MSYESRAYDNEHGDPVVVLVATGTHDVSRLVHLLSRGNSEQCGLSEQVLRQVRRHNGGRSALRLLVAHGGPDLLTADNPTGGVLDEVAAERHRQDRKFGEQNHPVLDPTLLERPGGCTPRRMAQEYEIPTAERARQSCQARGRDGQPDTWGHIIIEEFAEAVEAGTLEGEGPRLRAELLETAASCVAAVEAMDRRAASAAVADEQVPPAP